MKTIRITNRRLKSNKMKRTIIYSICLMSLFSACQKQDSIETDKNCSIYLSAGTVETRSPFEGTVPSEQEALNALVCVSTTEFSFRSDVSSSKWQDSFCRCSHYARLCSCSWKQGRGFREALNSLYSFSGFGNITVCIVRGFSSNVGNVLSGFLCIVAS